MLAEGLRFVGRQLFNIVFAMTFTMYLAVSRLRSWRSQRFSCRWVWCDVPYRHAKVDNVNVRITLTLEEVDDAINDWIVKHKITPPDIEVDVAWDHRVMYEGRKFGEAVGESPAIQITWTEVVVER